MWFNLLDAWLILDDDDILKVSLSTTGQSIDPLRSAGFQSDGKFIRVPISSVTNVMTIQVAMETLVDELDIDFQISDPYRNVLFSVLNTLE